MKFKKILLKQKLAIIIFISAFIVSNGVIKASTKQPEFEIYLQVIEEVKEEKPQNPQNWWDQAKLFASNVGKMVNMAVSQFKMRFMPKEGEYWVRSVEDINIKYKLRSVRIRSEEDLFKVWGVKSENELTHGQKAILAAYRTAFSDAIKYRAQYAFRNRPVPVIFTDTTKFDHIPTVKLDFWPMSLGSIQISTFNYNFPNSEEYARLTFIHEYAHTLDRSNPLGIVREAIKTTITRGAALYGKDKTHYTNERTTPKVAYLEGWAIFNEIIESERMAKEVIETIKTIAFEQKNGYVYKPAKEVSVEDLLATEGVVATILYYLAKEGSGGKDGVFKAFVDSNKKYHKICELKDFLRSYIKLYPQDESTVIKILQKVTYNKITSEQLSTLLGKTIFIPCPSDNENIVASSTNTEVASDTTSPSDNNQQTNTPDQNRIKVEGSSSSPFADY